MRVVGFNMIILDSDLYNLFGCQCIFLKIGMITNIIFIIIRLGIKVGM